MSRLVLESTFEGLCALLWPPRCPACHAPAFPAPNDPSSAFCALCADALLPLRSPRCPRCALPFEGAGEDHLCGACLRDPPPFQSAWAAFEYGGPAALACLRFKNGGQPQLARPLGQVLASGAPCLALVEIVVPVPLHPRRLARRGYNPSALLAAHLARRLGVPLRVDALLRRRDTVAQASLSAAARVGNLLGAFEARGDRVAGLRVLLVDDVVTTTATCRVASQALLEAGARSVHVAALLRAT